MAKSTAATVPDLRQDLRFAHWRRLPALAVLLATAALVVYGLFVGLTPLDRTSGIDPDQTDDALYVAVAARVADGENYYRAAAVEQRERGYPLRPFVTVREPALAYVTAAVGGPEPMMGLLAVLAFGTAMAMVWRLESTAPGRFSWWAAAALTALTAGTLVGHIQAVTHEVWAGMLVALSISFRTRKHFGVSVCLGLAAVLVRELALPYLVVMAFFALREGRRREMWSWIVAAAVFAVTYAFHAALVLEQTGPADPSSQGWLRVGGWPYVLDFVRASSFLSFGPGWIAATVVPFALLGWLGRRTPFAERVTLVIGAYVCAFLVVGRPENVYWGFLFALLLIPGLALAPSAIWQLGKRVAG